MQIAGHEMSEFEQFSAGISAVERACDFIVIGDVDGATLGTRPGMAHVTTREEVTRLLRHWKLLLDERGRRRAVTRAEWFAQAGRPLETHGLTA